MYTSDTLCRADDSVEGTLEAEVPEPADEPAQWAQRRWPACETAAVILYTYKCVYRVCQYPCPISRDNLGNWTA